MVKLIATVVFDAKNASDILELVDHINHIDKVEHKPPLKSKSKSIEERVNQRLVEQGKLVMRRGKWWRSTSEDIIKAILADGKPHHTSEFTAACLKEGYSKNTPSPKLVVLQKRGEIKMLGDGNYQLVKVES